MTKWTVHFTDGHTCTMLSPEADTEEKAMESAKWRFGSRVVKVSKI